MLHDDLLPGRAFLAAVAGREESKTDCRDRGRHVGRPVGEMWLTVLLHIPPMTFQLDLTDEAVVSSEVSIAVVLAAGGIVVTTGGGVWNVQHFTVARVRKYVTFIRLVHEAEGLSFVGLAFACQRC